jgi:hypothetical protein
MRVRTPSVLWHGGGMTNGKPDPVFSLDLNIQNVLATCGIDSSVPPRGSIHVSCFSVLFPVNKISLIFELFS